MAFLLDTEVAIHLRDGDATIVERVASLEAPPILSVITQVELEGGVYVKPMFESKRRAALDALLETMRVVPFEASEVAAYRSIVAAAGFSRPRIIDRMIAATALVHRLTLITMNGDDYRDITGLKFEVWPSPA